MTKSKKNNQNYHIKKEINSEMKDLTSGNETSNGAPEERGIYDLQDNLVGIGSKEITNNDAMIGNINKVRGRTFNKDLKNLIEKIGINESFIEEKEEKEEIEEIEEIEEGTDEFSENELLKKIHTLFYKSINLTELNETNTHINPYLFELDSFSRDNSLDSPHVLSIHKDMCDLSYSNYAILSYNLEKKCFLPLVCNIEDLDKNNIVIDPFEELYSDIILNEHGVILDNHTIKSNIYLKKRFISEGGSNYVLYFVSLKNIIHNFFKEMKSEIDGTILNLHFFSILMIKIKINQGIDSAESVYKKITERLILPLLVMEKNILQNIKETDCKNLTKIFDLIEYYYHLFSSFNDSICLIIKCKSKINNENLFILKYLYSKLIKSLSFMTCISQIERDKIMIFTQKNKGGIIDQIISEFNLYCDNMFYTESLETDKINNFNSLLINYLSQ